MKLGAHGLAGALALSVSLLARANANEPQQEPPKIEIIDHGRFEHLRLLRPDGAARSTVLLFSGRDGWDKETAVYAETLRQRQTLVAGIDTPALLKKLAEDGDNCEFLDGDLDNLGRFVQAYTHQDDYRAPLLFGSDEGAALVFGVLAQAPAKQFGGGVGVGFCPRSALHPPLCKGTSLQQKPLVGGSVKGSEFLSTSRLRAPFTAVITPESGSCDARNFLSRVPMTELQYPVRRRAGAPSAPAAAIVAYGKLAASVSPPHRRSEALPDLPLVEIEPTAHRAEHRDLFAVLLSGDGGWAGLDEELADTLAAHGIPVVGLDSLRYFWTARTPENVAADIDRVITHYADQWNRPRVMLLGYSQGADVLPFALNRLPPATRDRIALTGAVALSEHAAFEFHVGAWAGASGDESTWPEVRQLADRQDRFMVVCGADDEAAICPKLDAKHYRIQILPGSHHFDGNYENLASTLIDGLSPPAAAAEPNNEARH